MKVLVYIRGPLLAEVIIRRWFRREEHRFAVLDHGRWLDDVTHAPIADPVVLAAIELAHWRQLATAPPG